MRALKAIKQKLANYSQWAKLAAASFLFIIIIFLLFILFYFIFLAMPCGLWDLSSQTRHRTQAPAVKAPSPNHWTTKEFLSKFSFILPNSGLLNCILGEFLHLIFQLCFSLFSHIYFVISPLNFYL